ncbi:MAG: metal-dependent transcriptional regulator [Alphaproteobacteria bacterium]|nr:metal-dependent transcriptional regulator [Alphaproteobacteria bacterium]
MATVTSRLEDYLEALFLLEATGKKQTVTALAENLKLTKGTIATVVKKMAERKLVLHESYGAIRLTSKGRQIGWQVYMKHERLTSFFHDFLGQDAERSEEIACLIEHHLDGAAANRFFNLVHFLQQAQIEKKEWTDELLRSLENAVRQPMPLTLAAEDRQNGRVCRLTGSNKMTLDLKQSGIEEGIVLKSIGRMEDGGEYAVVLADGKRLLLDADNAATVWII